MTGIFVYGVIQICKSFSDTVSLVLIYTTSRTLLLKMNFHEKGQRQNYIPYWDKRMSECEDVALLWYTLLQQENKQNSIKHGHEMTYEHAGRPDRSLERLYKHASSLKSLQVSDLIRTEHEFSSATDAYLIGTEKSTMKRRTCMGWDTQPNDERQRDTSHIIIKVY
jgi:hypothetical protein